MIEAERKGKARAKGRKPPGRRSDRAELTGRCEGRLARKKNM